MTHFGFHASHEEITASKLLEAVRSAEEAGFELGMCSDHFAPWSKRQGQSGFAWAWLGAALASTSLPFGVVTAPGQQLLPSHRRPGGGDPCGDVAGAFLGGGR